MGDREFCLGTKGRKTPSTKPSDSHLKVDLTGDIVEIDRTRASEVYVVTHLFRKQKNRIRVPAEALAGMEKQLLTGLITQRRKDKSVQLTPLLQQFTLPA